MNLPSPSQVRVLLLLLALSFTPGRSWAESVRFRYSADPETVVLNIAPVKPVRPWSPPAARPSSWREDPGLVLYADGRVTDKNLSGEIFEASLSYSEVQDLLKMLSSHGILELGKDCIDPLLLERVGHKPQDFVVDGGVLMLHIELDAYEHGDSREEPFVKTLWCYSPGYVATTFPEIPQLIGFQKLRQFMHSLKDRAEYKRIPAERR